MTNVRMAYIWLAAISLLTHQTRLSAKPPFPTQMGSAFPYNLFCWPICRPDVRTDDKDSLPPTYAIGLFSIPYSSR